MAQSVAPPAVKTARRINVGSIILAALLLIVFSPLIWKILTEAVANPPLFIEAMKIGIINGAIIAIIALGYTLVYGIIELINFAHGDVYMLGAFATLILFTLLNISTEMSWAIRAPLLIIVFLAVMLITALINAAIERLAYRKLRNAPRLAPLISAIGVSFILQNIGLLLGGMSIRAGDYWTLIAFLAPIAILAAAYALARTLQRNPDTKIPGWAWTVFVIIAFGLSISGFGLVRDGLQAASPLEIGANAMGNTATGPKSLPEVLVTGANNNMIALRDAENKMLFRMTWKDLMALTVSTGLMFALYTFVQRTRIGKAMRATAQDRDAARLMGIDVDRTISLAFLLGGALAGAAGMIVGMYNNTAVFTMGFTAGLRAFTSAVLGGIGNIAGSMLGGMLIGIISSLSDIYIETRWTNAVVFGILVIILVFRPSGLLGEEGGQKA